MAKIYGNTINDPAEAPLGVVTSPGTALLLPEGFTIPQTKTATVSGTIAIDADGSLTSAGDVNVLYVQFSDADSNAKLAHYSTAKVTADVSRNLNAVTSTTIHYSRIGSTVTLTIDGVSGLSNGSNQQLEIKTEIPAWARPDRVVNGVAPVVDNTTYAFGLARMQTDGLLTLYAGPSTGNLFAADINDPKGFSTFSISYVIGTVAQQDSC